MPTPVQSFRPAPIVQQAVAHNGGGRGLSHRLAQIADRYLATIADRLPDLTDSEWSLLRDAMNGTIHEPADMIRLFADGIEDAIRLDGLDVKWGVDGPALLHRLRALSFAEAVAVVEAVEGWWATQGG
jgi:hypothetical protein